MIGILYWIVWGFHIHKVASFMHLDAQSSTAGCHLETLEALSVEDNSMGALSLLCETQYCVEWETSMKHSTFSIDSSNLANRTLEVFEKINSREKQTLVLAGSREMIAFLLQKGNNIDKELSQHEYYIHLHRWILLTDDDDLYFLSNYVGNITNVFAVTINMTHINRGSACHASFHTSFFHHGGARPFTDIGDYYNHQLIMPGHTDMFPNEKFGMNGRHVLIGTNLWPLYMYFEDRNGTQTLQGICVEIADAVAQAMNFTYTLVLPDGYVWGVSDKDGNWNGLIGLVQRREVDFVITHFTLTMERSMVMDYSHVLWHYESSVIMYRKPNPDDNNIGIFIQPFRFVLWLVIALSVPVTGGVLYLFTKLSPFYEATGHNNKLDKFRHSVWFMYGCLLAQGQVCLPQAHSGRIIASFWWLYVVILTASYTANLVASLTVVKISPPFTNLEELAAQDKYIFGTLGKTSWEQSFRESDMQMYKNIWSRIMEFEDRGLNVIFNNHSHNLNRVTQEDFAYVADETSAATLMAKNCKVTTAPYKFMQNPYTIGLQQNSVHTLTVTDITTALSDSGMLQQWKTQYTPPPLQCESPGVKPLSLFHLQGVFAILAAGVLAGLIAIPMEHISRGMKIKEVSFDNSNGKKQTLI